MKKQLPSVTLVVADTYYYGEAIQSLKKSLNQIEPAKALFLTDMQMYNPNLPFEIVNIKKLDGRGAYSKFILKELNNYFDTDFVLVTQHDGWVLDGNAWDDEFFEYDYIGAPWLEVDGYNMGNGGFSLRSKKLQKILAEDDFIKHIHTNEDVAICRIYRGYLEEKYGIKYATDEIGDRFSFELREPIQSTFGFHGKFHNQYKPTIVVKRDAAGGDIIAVEPVLEYYYKKGYRVVIDAPLHFAILYASHHYPIAHISQLTDNRIVPELIDLNMAYENRPKMNHLAAYYEAAGITDGEMKSPKLNFHGGNPLFKNFIVLHIDKRDQPYRNIYGVNWEKVVAQFNDMGYNVVQIGQMEHEEVKGAIQFNTPITTILPWLISGAQGFIGIDSFPSHIAVATGVKSMIFFGSVDADIIHPDLSNVYVMELIDVCDTPKCWHNLVSTTGQDCVVNKELPPCSVFDTDKVIERVKEYFS